MQTHIPTLFQIIVLVNFVLAGVIAAVGYRRKPELMLWSASLLVHGVAYALFGLRGQISDLLSIWLANTAIATTYALVAEGLFQFLRRPAPRSLVWSPVLLTAVGFAVLLDDYAGRIVLSSLVFGAQGLALAYWLLRHRHGITGRGKYLFLGSALLISSVLLGRLLLLPGSQPGEVGFAASGALNALTYLTGIITLVIFVIGLLLMSWERDERAVRESEARMRMLFENTSDAMLILDDCVVADCNPAALRLFGAQAQTDLLGRSLAALSPEQQPDGEASPERARAHCEAAVPAHPHRFDWVCQRLDNQQSFIADVLLNAIQVDGKPGVLAVVRDITERKRQQLELERRVLARTEALATARDEAESANAVKTRFMANVSHEMRTPMLGILGFAEIGRSKVGKKPDEVIIDFFDKIIDSGQRLHRLTESLLSLADDAWRVQAGSEDAHQEPVDLARLASECIVRMEKTASDKAQHMYLEQLGAVTHVPGDAARIRQVLEHLLSNAVRFSPRETHVTVRILNTPAGSPTPTRVLVQVIDQGCGIPEKELKAIFEPFYESTRTASGAGSTGLGLALCRSIMQRHKGSITVTNRPEGGAVFELSFPLASPGGPATA